MSDETSPPAGRQAGSETGLDTASGCAKTFGRRRAADVPAAGSADIDWTSLSAAEAIPALLERHGGRLFTLALRLCGSREDAEELVQDVFLTALETWDRFEGRAEPTTWLYTIASRACLRKQRRRAGEPKALDSIDELTSHREDLVPALGGGTDPLDDHLRREAREHVEAALRQVPSDFRMALVLKDIVELSLAEVAEVLDIKPATAKTRVYRARLALRRALAESLPKRPARDLDAPPVCRDLLLAKLDALDRGVDFPLPPELLSDRCSTFFRTLDLTRDACRSIGVGEVPPAVRARLGAAIGAPSAG